MSTIIGEVHWNFYLFGLLLLPVILCLTDLLLKYIFQDTEYGIMLLFLFGILIFRMAYSDIILTSLFVFLFTKLTNYFNKKLDKTGNELYNIPIGMRGVIYLEHR